MATDQLLPGGVADSYEPGQDIELSAQRGPHTSDLELVPEDNRQTHRLLYTSHFLSTWNSRLFEFGGMQVLSNHEEPQTSVSFAVLSIVTMGSGEAYTYPANC